MKIRFALLAISLFLVACGTSGSPVGPASGYGHEYHVICPGGMYDGVVQYKKGELDVMIEVESGNVIRFPSDSCVWITIS